MNQKLCYSFLGSVKSAADLKQLLQSGWHRAESFRWIHWSSKHFCEQIGNIFVLRGKKNMTISICPLQLIAQRITRSLIHPVWSLKKLTHTNFSTLAWSAQTPCPRSVDRARPAPRRGSARRTRGARSPTPPSLSCAWWRCTPSSRKNCV